MRAIVSIVFLFLILASANAAEVHLKDGSIVVGSILKLEDGEDLIVDTEYMDEVTIEWDAIKSIHETQVVEIELFDGRRVFGPVVLDERGLTVLGASPEVMVRLVSRPWRWDGVSGASGLYR